MASVVKELRKEEGQVKISVIALWEHHTLLFPGKDFH